MKKIEAKIVADSINLQGNRITSFLLTYPRFIHSELMTHRLFSRNSASSRAIPFNKMVKMIEEDPFIPIAWQKDHRGMQGNDYIVDPAAINNLRSQWLNASHNSLGAARQLNLGAYQIDVAKDLEGNIMRGFTRKDLPDTSVTKQLCNRLLEPFMWHTVLVTATEWKNFFELRCPHYELSGISSKRIYSRKDYKKIIDELSANEGFDIQVGLMTDLDWIKMSKSGAEIHIQALAEAMWDAMNESTPKFLREGEWHLPFSENLDSKEVDRFAWITHKHLNLSPNEVVRKICIARCARLSYMTHEGEIDYEKDVKMHDSLLLNKHMSPFEHCAKAMNDEEYYSFVKGQIPTIIDEYGITNLEMMPVSSGHSVVGFTGINSNNGNKYGWCNNFKGWIQYRYLIE
jgi:thymidylate synthase ThyX